MTSSSRPECALVEASRPFQAPELDALTFADGDLELRLLTRDGVAFRLAFPDVIGFRVLDERDLLEFWNACSQPNGWLWCVLSGGWFDLERRRPGFDAVRWYDAAREYLVVGDTCVSILSNVPPEFRGVAPASGGS